MKTRSWRRAWRAHRQELRALEAAGQEFGLSAEAMRNGVQALYRSVRDDPEAAAALRKQGISTHDDEGNQRSTADLARALSNVLQKLDGSRRTSWASSSILTPP